MLVVKKRFMKQTHRATGNPVGEEFPVPFHQSESEDGSHLVVPDFINIEANLAALGFFTPSNKRIRERKTVKITKYVDGKKEERRVTFIPIDLGLPTAPADQDKYLVFMKIVQDLKKKQGTINNPITFTTAEILNYLGKTDAGKNYKEVQDWLQKMRFTGIISDRAVYYAGRKEWRSDTVNVFGRVVSKGAELENGIIAEKHYVFLSDWQLENLRHNHALPLDLETYKRLKNHIAKALLPALQIALYASQSQGYFEKRYTELCQFLRIRKYRYVSDIKRKLGSSLDELQQHGYIKRWEIAKTADGKEYKIIFWHGEKFYLDQRGSKGKPQSSALEEGSDITDRPDGNHSKVTAPPETKAQQEAEQRIDSQPLVTRLMKRGISEKKAQQLLAELPPDQPVEEQLEYAESEIAKQGTGPDGIPRPAGFIINRLRENAPVPDHFVSEAERAKLSEAILRRVEISRGEEDAYQVYLDREVNRYIEKEYTPESFKAYLESKKLALRKHRPKDSEERLNGWVEASAREQILEKISPQLHSQHEFIQEQRQIQKAQPDQPVGE